MDVCPYIYYQNPKQIPFEERRKFFCLGKICLSPSPSFHNGAMTATIVLSDGKNSDADYAVFAFKNTETRWKC